MLPYLPGSVALTRCLIDPAVSRLETLASATLQHVWYPFTQHQGMTEENVTVIDSRAGESFMVYQNQCDSFGHKSQSLVPKHDACSSWWTQVSY